MVRALPRIVNTWPPARTFDLGFFRTNEPHMMEAWVTVSADIPGAFWMLGPTVSVP